MNTIKDRIYEIIRKEKEIKPHQLARHLGISRQYLARFLRELKEEGKIVRIGKTNRVVYVLAEKGAISRAKSKIKTFHRLLLNKNLSEDIVLDLVKRESGVFADLKKNIISILDYGFTEMLNNAIDHSQSKKIDVSFRRGSAWIRFEVSDSGVGIFQHIMKNKGLKSELEAIQDLLKGKQTTDPANHSGEGIFFTSKMADALSITSSTKKLIFNNIVDDVFIHDSRPTKGTRVVFVISTDSARKTETIFGEYTSGFYEFDKTKVLVRLYKMGTLYMSRSQARRIMVGMNEFKNIILDFDHIKSVGQGFADEIFRVWKAHNSQVKIEVINSNENIDFMIGRALKESKKLQKNLFSE